MKTSVHSFSYQFDRQINMASSINNYSRGVKTVKLKKSENQKKTRKKLSQKPFNCLFFSYLRILTPSLFLKKCGQLTKTSEEFLKTENLSNCEESQVKTNLLKKKEYKKESTNRFDEKKIIKSKFKRIKSGNLILKSEGKKQKASNQIKKRKKACDENFPQEKNKYSKSERFSVASLETKKTHKSIIFSNKNDSEKAKKRDPVKLKNSQEKCHVKPFPLFCQIQQENSDFWINPEYVKGNQKKAPASNLENEENKVNINCIEEEELIKNINRTYKFDLKYNDFFPKLSFIETIRREFGQNLNDIHKNRNFNFLKLKIVWSQFLSNEKIKSNHFDKMSSFELLLFKTFLFRFGYLSKTKSSDNEDLKRFPIDLNTIQNLAAKVKIVRTEQQMLECALKQVFKKLMHRFSLKNKDKQFYSDMGTIHLTANENEQFYRHYFGDLCDEQRTLNYFYITESILSSTVKMIDYIRKMKQSPRVLEEIKKFCFNFDNKKRFEDIEHSEISISGSTLLKRHKYDIADKINKRINNYEIILNQFNHKLEKNKIYRWMGIILRDLKLNPKVKIPWNIFELNESVKLLVKYLKE